MQVHIMVKRIVITVAFIALIPYLLTTAIFLWMIGEDLAHGKSK